MFEKIIFDKTFYNAVTFRVESLSGSKIYIKGKCFYFSFDKDNEKQMELIADVLLDFYDMIECDLKTDQEKDKLKDFDNLIGILNRYKGE